MQSSLDLKEFKEEAIALAAQDVADDDVRPMRYTSAAVDWASFFSDKFFCLKKRTIEAEQALGSTIGFYLRFSRFVFSLILCLVVTCSVFFYEQFFSLRSEGIHFLTPSSGFYPNFLVPSSFGSSTADILAVAIFWSIIVFMVFIGFFMWLSCSLTVQYNAKRAGKTEDTPHFLGMIYSFDWSKYKPDQIAAQRSMFLENVQIEMEEEAEEKSRLINRKLAKSNGCRECFGVSILLTYVIGFFGSFMYIHENGTDFSEKKWPPLVKLIASSLAPFLVVISNVVGPPVVQWAETLTNLTYATASKKFSSRLMAYSLPRVLGLLPLILSISEKKKNNDDCLLNVVTGNLLTVMFSAFIIDKLIDFAVCLLPLLFRFMRPSYRALSPEEKYLKRPEPNLPLLLTRLMYHLTLTMFVLPFSPVAVLFSLLLAYATFLYDEWMLSTLYRPPAVPIHKHESQSFIAGFLHYSLFFIALVFVVFLLDIKHNCGAFIKGVPTQKGELLRPSNILVYVALVFLIFCFFSAMTFGETYSEQLTFRKRAANGTIKRLKNALRELSELKKQMKSPEDNQTPQQKSEENVEEKSEDQ
ncbi:hypothetical protein RCL1_003306 [Eukaryota sp. TZLM3-RCL]